ncbi:hypothetical protein TheetDRAFT_3326 [Thermoanaerobacter ethanolicus JW 200]|nr:hypothetical protein TheetDRAFT_3326 [Thermoanaerobacter ethanolicus JW 200]
MEPYPLFMADRMVKHLGSAMPAFRQSSTRQIIELYEDEDFSEIFLLCMDIELKEVSKSGGF